MNVPVGNQVVREETFGEAVLSPVHLFSIALPVCRYHCTYGAYYR